MSTNLLTGLALTLIGLVAAPAASAAEPSLGVSILAGPPTDPCRPTCLTLTLSLDSHDLQISMGPPTDPCRPTCVARAT